MASQRRVKGENIEVVVRVRPLNGAEKRNEERAIVRVDPISSEIIIPASRFEANGADNYLAYSVDKVFGPKSDQLHVYRDVMTPLLEDVQMGYNATVFAYGQTGTGKTYTMEGDESTNTNLLWNEDPTSGIIPRTLHHLFHDLGLRGVNYSIKASFVQLYNEEIHDLLSNDGDVKKLRLFEDPYRKGSVIIDGVKEIDLKNKPEVFAALEQGRKRRKKTATLLNANSSRSHTVFSVTVSIREPIYDGNTQEELLTIGKLNLVDLAGSESIGRSGAVSHEAGQINKSLLTLGRVISALTQSDKALHIPYRESCLTRILQDSLGGASKACIIATISPAACSLDETQRTLEFALRAKDITNRPEVHTVKQTKPKAPSPPATPAPEVFRQFSFPQFAEVPDADVISDLMDHYMDQKQRRAGFAQEIVRKETKFLSDLKKLELAHYSHRKRFDEEHRYRLDAEKKKRHLEQKVGVLNRQLLNVQNQLHRNQRDSKVAASQEEELRKNAQRFAQLCAVAGVAGNVSSPVRKANSQEDVNGGGGGGGYMRKQNQPAGRGPGPSYMGGGRSPSHNSLYPKLAELNNNAVGSDTPNQGGGSATPRRMGPPTLPKPKSSNARRRAPSPPPSDSGSENMQRGRAHINRKFHRRSRSVGASGIVINHQSAGKTPSGQFFQPVVPGRSKNVTTVGQGDLRTASDYVLTHQETDRAGNLRTNLVKGDVVPTAGGGSAVLFNDIESVQHRQISRKRNSSSSENDSSAKQSRI